MRRRGPRSFVPPTSANRLLVLWAPAVPLTAFVSLVLDAPAPAIIICPGAWVALNLWNRAAWRRHFRPRR